MRLIIKDNAQNVADWTSKYIQKQINTYSNPTNPFVLGLSTGSSPLPTYKLLVQYHKKGELSFKNVMTFNMDEYVGLPKEHPESYYSFMWNNLFSHIDIKKENVHILNGNAVDLIKECHDYEQAFKKSGYANLFLGGLGVDGHIAFNEPGTSLNSRTHIQKLTYETRIVNSRFFDNDINQVPDKALTVGVATITDSQKVIMVVTGHQKARALQQTVEGSVSHIWTASALQYHNNAIIVCDEASCAELKVGTYHYFKEMEENSL